MVQYIKKKLPRNKNKKRKNKFYLNIKEPTKTSFKTRKNTMRISL